MTFDPAATATDLVGMAIATALDRKESGRPLVVGLCGAQGSGKSTIAAGLCRRMDSAGLSAATLSLDDLYRTRAERAVLTRDVHPLFATRGVPGTHDVALGRAMFDAVDHGMAVMLPRFDKARDDRSPTIDWPLINRPEVVIFEGWCVGARPQAASALAAPVNALERDADDRAIWRTSVNEALGGDYQCLFARIDVLVLLAAPSFATIVAWRIEQEQRLRAITPAGEGVMSDLAVVRFVAHYERLTRWILDEMPARATLTINLAPDRSPLTISLRSGP